MQAFSRCVRSLVAALPLTQLHSPSHSKLLTYIEALQNRNFSLKERLSWRVINRLALRSIR